MEIRPTRSATARLITWAAFALVGLDRIAKTYALVGVQFDWNLVRFDLFYNPGIAFSIPIPAIIFWPAAILIMSGLGALLGSALKHGEKVNAALLLMIILGAASNTLDRALFDSVIDYLIFFDRSAVNVADGMILGGVIALLSVQREPRETSQGRIDG